MSDRYLYLALLGIDRKEIDFPGYRRVRVLIAPEICEERPGCLNLKKKQSFQQCDAPGTDIWAIEVVAFDAYGGELHRRYLHPPKRVMQYCTAEVMPSESTVTAG